MDISSSPLNNSTQVNSSESPVAVIPGTKVPFGGSQGFPLSVENEVDYKFEFICRADDKTSLCHIKKRYASVKGYSGELCQGCPWAGLKWFIIWSTPYNSVQKYKKAEAKTNRKIRRFVIDANQGATCGVKKRKRFRWFVITQSPEAVEKGLSIGKTINGLVTLIRYYSPDFQCMVIHHIQARGWYRKREGGWTFGGLRDNWHILSYGDKKLPLGVIEKCVQKYYKSTTTGLEEIRDIRKSIRYLAGYLSREGKFIGYTQTQGWIFKGHRKFSKEYHRRYGSYPEYEVLASLSLLESSSLSYELESLLSTGYMSEYYRSKGLVDYCVKNLGGILEVEK